MFRKLILVLIRPRSLSISSGSHLNLFHVRFILLLTSLVSEPSSVFESSIRCSSSRTFRQPLSMSSKPLFWSSLSSWFGNAESTSWRIIERLLTLFDHYSQQSSKSNVDNALIWDSLELTWCVNEFLPDLVGKFDRCNKVAYTKPKAHYDVGLLITSKKGRKMIDQVVASYWRNTYFLRSVSH